MRREQVPGRIEGLVEGHGRRPARGHETAYGADYQVQVSNDTAAWMTIRSVTNGDGLELRVASQLVEEQANVVAHRRLGDPFFGIFLNAGHQIHLDEWVNSPITPGSMIPLASGMAFQVDIIPATGTAAPQPVRGERA